ncbi:hypothetical protein HC733_22155 [Pseudoalteromonas sp. S16_S37]|nr:hypothetical protein [Pseudoalteromonas sp. S16_S37]
MQSLLVEQLTLTPLDTVTTNKEGQFSLSLGRNDIVLLATGSREFFGTTEKYIWIKPVELGVGFNYIADLDNTGIISDKPISSIKL